MSEVQSDIGLVGLAVMGQNLALNIADHGFRISVYNRTTSKTDAFVSENPDTPGGLFGAQSVEEFVQSIKCPRKIIILVQAGRATDAVIEGLLPLLDPDDIIIDGGNALWTDTIRREKDLNDKGFRFVGSGVSGGEEGARFGPSLMPGGKESAWEELKPIWEAIAAKVDAETGKPIEGAAPGKPVTGGGNLHDLYRRKRGGTLREDDSQRDRVRRHANDLRGLRADGQAAGHEPQRNERCIQ